MQQWVASTYADCYLKMNYCYKEYCMKWNHSLIDWYVKPSLSLPYTVKPKTPTVQMVKPTRIGNFLVKWKTNYPDDVPFSKDLIAELSYRKKGETDEVKEGDLQHSPGCCHITKTKFLLALSFLPTGVQKWLNNFPWITWQRLGAKHHLCSEGQNLYWHERSFQWLEWRVGIHQP